MLVPKTKNYQELATRGGLCLWCSKIRKLSHLFYDLNLMTEGENVQILLVYKNTYDKYFT
jgi:hypothetical protein